MIIKKLYRALRGLWSIIRTEHTMQFLAVLAVVALVFSSRAGLSPLRLLGLFGPIVFLAILEGINTVFEQMTDLIEPRFNERVRDIKDALAGIVLIAAAASVVIWYFVLFR